jgi:glycosyltransferase involved in cell wall biosynthesis
MRILYLALDSIPVGGANGAGVHVLEMLRALEAEGHETALACRFLGADYDDERRTYCHTRDFRNDSRPTLGARVTSGLEQQHRAVNYLRDGAQLAHTPLLNRLVQQAVQDFAPDVIYERYGLFRAEGLRAARKMGLPYVLEVNAPLAREARARGLALKRLAGWLERRSWRLSDLVVTVSVPLADLVRSTGQDSVIVVPNAVDPARFQGGNRAATRARLRLDGRFVVGFVGSMNPWHDLRALVDAVRLLPTSLRAVLLLVGDGPLRPEVEQHVATRGIDARFVGAVSRQEVPDLLSAMDACVCGLRAEHFYGSPMKALEYLAAAKPTVLTPGSTLEEIAAIGGAALYPPGDEEALARELVAIAEKPGHAQALATRGAKYAEAHTWRQAARRVVEATCDARGALG